MGAKPPGHTCTVKPETLTNPHYKTFDKINFDELLDIFIEKVVIGYIDLLKFGEFTRIRQIRQSFHSPKFPVLRYMIMRFHPDCYQLPV